MMADHGEPCDGREATYCMNGATCYKITMMNTLSCVCNDNYKGSRCEQFELLTGPTNAERAGLIVALVTVALLFLVVLAVIIYYKHRLRKAKQQNQQRPQCKEYWRVSPRVM